MDIYNVLKDKLNTRITCGDRWLVMDKLQDANVFIIYERSYAQKVSKKIYEGSDEELACLFLLNESE